MLVAWGLSLALLQVPTSDAREIGPFRAETETKLTFPGLYLPDFEYGGTRRWVHRFSLRLKYPRLRLLSLDAVTVAPDMNGPPLAKRFPVGPPPGGPAAWFGASVAAPRSRVRVSAGRVLSLATGAFRVAGMPKLLVSGQF